MFGLFKKSPPASELPQLGAEQLQPRIKHIHFTQALKEAGVPTEQFPAITPLCGELVTTYAFDLPDSFVMATPSLLQQAQLSAADCAKVGAGNLLRNMGEVIFLEKDGCRLAQCGGDLEATLLLVDAFWDHVRSDMQIKAEVLAAAPRRNRLLMCDSADPAAILALRAQARSLFDERDDGHRLSTQIMTRRNGGWSLFDSH